MTRLSHSHSVTPSLCISPAPQIRSATNKNCSFTEQWPWTMIKLQYISSVGPRCGIDKTHPICVQQLFDFWQFVWWHVSVASKFSNSHKVGIFGGWRGGWTPHFMSTDAHFWVKIDFQLQSLGKISNISTSDPPPVLLGQFQHWVHTSHKLRSWKPRRSMTKHERWKQVHYS